jgi:hypothetical protein
LVACSDILFAALIALLLPAKLNMVVPSLYFL